MKEYTYIFHFHKKIINHTYNKILNIENYNYFTILSVLRCFNEQKKNVLLFR